MFPRLSNPSRRIACCYFGAAKKDKSQSDDKALTIRNQNLIFKTSGYDMHMYLFYPQITRKTGNIFDINKESTVIAFTFVPTDNYTNENNEKGRKSEKTDGKKKNNNKEDSSESTSMGNWNYRKSITFRFGDLIKLLEVEANSDKSYLIERKKEIEAININKSLRITDIRKDKAIELKLSEADGSAKNMTTRWDLTARMSYPDYRLIQMLIKDCLLDLSGIRIMLDVKRAEYMEKIGIVGKDQKTINNEINDLYSNAPDLVDH